MAAAEHDIQVSAHLCTTHSRMSSAASRAARRVETRSKMQMPMAWLVMDGLAIQVADPSTMSLTCGGFSTMHQGCMRAVILTVCTF